MGNNPINGVDPDGAFTEWIDSKGNTINNDGVDNGILIRINDDGTQTLLADNFNWIAGDTEAKWYVKSQADILGYNFDDIMVNRNADSPGFNTFNFLGAESDGKYYVWGRDNKDLSTH
jgi:hypothetical protein